MNSFITKSRFTMKTLKAILLLFPTLIFGQSLFEEANQAYKSKDYQQAIDLYQKIITSGQHSAELYYNLANAYYKLNKVGPAIYNYEKSLLLAPNDSEVKNNLRFAQNMMIDPIKKVPKVGFKQWLQNYTSVFHYDTWAKISIGFSFFILFSFVGYYFVGRTNLRRVFFVFMILFFVSSVVAIAISLFEKDLLENYKEAIVFSESIAVKSEPSQNSTNVALIHEGTKVEILDELDDYYKVELPDQSVGWIVKKSVEILSL